MVLTCTGLKQQGPGSIIDSDGPIDDLRPPYDFLSNDYPVDIVYNNTKYPSVTVAIAAIRCLREEDRQKVLLAGEKNSAARAEQIAAQAQHIAGWDAMKDSVVPDLLLIKFTTMVPMIKLLQTKRRPIIYKSKRHDKYAGICTCDACRGGNNWLGEKIMKIRDVDLPKQRNYARITRNMFL